MIARAQKDELTVTVDGLRYDNISAVGIGHLRKDLVLVPAAAAQSSVEQPDGTFRAVPDIQPKPIECGTGWGRLVIDRADLGRSEAVLQSSSVEAVIAEAERMRALLNTPEIHDFAKAVVLEAAHQRERWPEGHDAQKSDENWFWLVGYLAGKALRPDQAIEKRLHRIITIAAAACNWHMATSALLSVADPGCPPTVAGSTDGEALPGRPR